VKVSSLQNKFNFLIEENISQVDKRTILEICKKMFHPKDTNFDIPEKVDQD